MFVLALAVGITVYETTLGTTLGNLGFGEVTFPKPTFHGDTVRVETEIVETRFSKSRMDSGIVTFRHVARNQRNEIVCTALRTGLMMLRPADKA
jgi:acyl dehydratase